PDWHVGQCQSGTWRKVGSGELQIATAQAQVGAFLEQQLLVQLENVLQVARNMHLTNWLHMAYQVIPSANNSWSAACDTTEDQNGSITVYAICQ
ncbi:shufflon protein B, partial [Salmonella enterica]|uniref:shufflon protein B n=1 Tax=Salmonella enterica TaxID=28901 RepID=UPI0039A71CDE